MGGVISNEKELVVLFNESYINYKISSGTKISSLRNCSDPTLDESTVKTIISKYSACPSI